MTRYVDGMSCASPYLILAWEVMINLVVCDIRGGCGMLRSLSAHVVTLSLTVRSIAGDDSTH